MLDTNLGLKSLTVPSGRDRVVSRAPPSEQAHVGQNHPAAALRRAAEPAAAPALAVFAAHPGACGRRRPVRLGFNMSTSSDPRAGAIGRQRLRQQDGEAGPAGRAAEDPRCLEQVVDQLSALKAGPRVAKLVEALSNLTMNPVKLARMPEGKSDIPSRMT